MPNREIVENWVERYVHAWSTSDRGDIEALFTNDAEYHERGSVKRAV
ncbi:hypothetical protein [Lentzea flaviverrucosa]|uniref:SnoaL-like domain-containing protein n=1 Tax=Lentzea flaviverrucosa TaxID=200379 RepID=A0A1H9BCR1_9PSEU|nr:hypothetical protein [Lentzea flaviverrucosa]RDI31831.1 hypothetical protein DFR72_103231 [Lentzea flaviverrucosa]SEP86048.1 hypothetical protein SAMN05216195_101426 [Lentzea flaviverrucosa]